MAYLVLLTEISVERKNQSMQNKKNQRPQARKRPNQSKKTNSRASRRNAPRTPKQRNGYKVPEALPTQSYKEPIHEKLRQVVESSTIDLMYPQTVKVTITTGFELKNKDVTLDDWIATADEKLYRGKNSGKNKVVF